MHVTGNGAPPLLDKAVVTAQLRRVNEAPVVPGVAAPRGRWWASQCSPGPPGASDALMLSVVGGDGEHKFADHSATGQLQAARNTPTIHAAQALLMLLPAGDLRDDAWARVYKTEGNWSPEVSAATFPVPKLSAVGTLVGCMAVCDPDGHRVTYGRLASLPVRTWTCSRWTRRGRMVRVAVSLSYEGDNDFCLVISATATVRVTWMNKRLMLQQLAGRGAPRGHLDGPTGGHRPRRCGLT